MKKQLLDVKEFHDKHHSTWNSEPTLVDENIREHRIEIMQSEVDELAEAIREGDIEHIAKEISDVLYVLFGTIGTLGLADKIPAVFDEVHGSNMSQDYSGTPDSKAVKGPNYYPADVKKVLE